MLAEVEEIAKKEKYPVHIIKVSEEIGCHTYIKSSDVKDAINRIINKAAD